MADEKINTKLEALVRLFGGINIPDAPAGLPAGVVKKWKEAYAAASKEALVDWPDDPTTQRQAALREANRLLRTPELTSYEQTMGLEDWHFILRQPSADGKTLRVVTRHGKKATFDIPAKKQTDAATGADSSKSTT